VALPTVWDRTNHHQVMAGTGSDKPRTSTGQAMPPRKPLAILHISRREEEEEQRSEQAPAEPTPPAAIAQPEAPTRRDVSDDDLGGLTMADLLGAAPAPERRQPTAAPSAAPAARASRRSVDDFDFDEQAFLAALDENEPVGTTGEVVSGVVNEHESDGIYVDIGGRRQASCPRPNVASG